MDPSSIQPERWRSGNTKGIRVPECLAEILLSIARIMDSYEDVAVREVKDKIIVEFSKPYPEDVQGNAPHLAAAHFTSPMEWKNPAFSAPV